LPVTALKLVILWAEKKNIMRKYLKRQGYSVYTNEKNSTTAAELAFLSHVLRKHGLQNLMATKRIEGGEQGDVRD